MFECHRNEGEASLRVEPVDPTAHERADQGVVGQAGIGPYRSHELKDLTLRVHFSASG
jgi:hypothetical protein